MHARRLISSLTVIGIALIWAQSLSAATPIDDATLKAAWTTAQTTNTTKAYNEFLALYGTDLPTDAVDNAHQTDREKLYWSAKEAIEKLVIFGIEFNGVRNRFCITELQGRDAGWRGSLTILPAKDSSDAFLDVPLFPGDQLHFAADGTSEGPPSVAGSVVRFAGTLHIRALTLTGSDSDPLSFLITKDKGFVYIGGTGTVVDGDKTTTLPPKSN